MVTLPMSRSLRSFCEAICQCEKTERLGEGVSKAGYGGDS